MNQKLKIATLHSQFQTLQTKLAQTQYALVV